MSTHAGAFEQGDEAVDEESRLDPDFIEELEQDPSLDPALQIDERENEEAGIQFDDPEDLVSLEGGIDDPDGREQPTHPGDSQRRDSDGWDLDATANKTQLDEDPVG
jgi:hypothetical protein